MDFGDILNKWEKQNANRNEVYDKDSTDPPEKNNAGERRSRLLRKKPDAIIDLHGLTRDEAWTALETFFENSRRDECEKVLIIHGKGNHGNEGVLKDLSRQFIESCSFAGESGHNSAREGGTGATWVILKTATVPGK
ncbi:MAG: Smr/MutS family protein [Treponema sp.]|nr:Smr/MutS family protein [Treponema sp.]